MRNPFGIEAMPTAVAGLADTLAALGILAASVLGVGAVLVRYRRGSIVERQQLRWFVAAVMLAVIPIAVSPQPGIGGPGVGPPRIHRPGARSRVRLDRDHPLPPVRA